MTETIQDIPGFEGRYAVTITGKVYSYRSKKYLKPYILNRRVRVHLGGKNYTVHRLVAKTFLANPENKPQVNHIDGNPSNNSLDNLEWCTCKENVVHAMQHGLHVSARRRKLSEKDRQKMLELRSMGYTTIRLGEMFGMAQTNVSQFLCGKSYRC